MKAPIQFLLVSLATVAYSAIMAAAQQPQQQHTGYLFNFAPSLGACGFTNTPADIVASVSSVVFTTFPGATANPNRNPICKHKVFIRAPGNQNKTILAQIVDFFPATTTPNTTFNIGLSPAAFSRLAPLTDGVVPNVTWSIV